MTELRVFFDADALLAGSASTTGASHLLLHLSDLGLIRGLTSEQDREEARRNLARKIPGALPEFDALIRQAIEVVPDANARWLVTFNTRHYYRTPPGTQVIEPGQAIQAIRIALVRLSN